ncbi:MAG: flagellin [Hyphomicrobiales bacterium]|nr:flagellin [Hyphomicrobiales bacterium]
MSSILTNSVALTVLQSMTATEKALEQTQSRVATGLRVNSAADDPAYWSIATTLRSDKAALGAVTDALAIGSAALQVALSAFESTISILTDFKARLVAAREPGIDRSKIQDELAQFQSQLQSIATSASFNNENWLAQDSGLPGYNSTLSIVSSFSRNNNAISIGTIDFDTSAIKMFDSNDQSGIIDSSRTVNASTSTIFTMDISTLTNSAADLQTLEDYLQMVDDAHADVNRGASALGAVKSRAAMQEDFVGSLLDSLTKGIGQLVDADMPRESTRLQALQTQQQLGAQALQIANANSQIILSLFRN